MQDDTITTGMIDALEHASSFQLYQLQAVIQGMLADTRRAMLARAALHPGQAVHFVDFRTGQRRQGQVIAKHDTQATVLEASVRRQWKIPYVAIEAAKSAPGEAAKPYDPPPEPAAPASPSGFKLGDKVSFDDRAARAQIGVVSKVNRRTATVGTPDGKMWRVDFGLLRHVLDV